MKIPEMYLRVPQMCAWTLWWNGAFASRCPLIWGLLNGSSHFATYIGFVAGANLK